MRSSLSWRASHTSPDWNVFNFGTLENKGVNNILCSSNIFLAYLSPLFPFVSSWLHPLPLIEMFSTLKHLQTSKWQCNENIDIWESWHEHLKTKWQYMYSDIIFLLLSFSIHCYVPAGQSWSKFEEFANYLERSSMQFVFIKFSAFLKHILRLFINNFSKLSTSLIRFED